MITREQGRPAMYYWFYTQTDPRRVQAAQATAAKDQGEFLNFENVLFADTTSQLKTGIIASSEETYQQLAKQNRSVHDAQKITRPDGKTVWMVYQLD